MGGRDSLIASAERLFRGRLPGPVPEARGPLILTHKRDRTILAYENGEEFTQVLQERYEDQTVEVVIQVTYVKREDRRESDYVDVEVFDGPSLWGGSAGKEIDVAGRPKVRLPTERELLGLAAKYGAVGARAVVRSEVLRGAKGRSPDEPLRHLYRGRRE